MDIVGCLPALGRTLALISILMCPLVGSSAHCIKTQLCRALSELYVSFPVDVGIGFAAETFPERNLLSWPFPKLPTAKQRGLNSPQSFIPFPIITVIPTGGFSPWCLGDGVGLSRQRKWLQAEVFPLCAQAGMVRTCAERGSLALGSRRPRSLFLALAELPRRAQDAVLTAAPS